MRPPRFIQMFAKESSLLKILATVTKILQISGTITLNVRELFLNGLKEQNVI